MRNLKLCMENLDEFIHLAFGFDQNFVTPFYVLLTSIFANNKKQRFHLHIIATGVSVHDREGLVAFIKHNNSVVFFYDVDEAYVASFSSANSDARYGLATYYRLLLPAMLPKAVKKVIYLDVDIIVVGSLGELYHTQVADVPVAAVPDPVEWDRPDLGVNREDYFNAGVLLINTDLWIKQEISYQAIAFLREFPEKATYVDQDALNYVLINNWRKLPEKFNLTYRAVPLQSRAASIDFVKSRTIIHYNEGAKPWHYHSTSPLKFLYHHYFKLSPKRNEHPYLPLRLSQQQIKQLTKYKLLNFYINQPFIVKCWRILKRKATK
jgi:lipopolysaccharide biosynthesis glycosyltransferase